MLSKEKIEEYHEHFSNHGSGCMDAAPLVDTARVVNELYAALDHLHHLVSCSKQPPQIKEALQATQPLLFKIKNAS